MKILSKESPTQRLILLTALFAALTIASYYFRMHRWTGEKGTQDHIEIDGLSVSSAALRVGEIWENKTVEIEVPIQNVTNRPISIRDFVRSCRCIEVIPQSLVIPGGESQTIRVRIDARSRSPWEIGQAERAFAYEISPVTEQKKPRKGWELQGAMRSRVTLDRQKIHFGENVVAGQQAAPITVDATVHAPAERIAVAIMPDVATVRVVRLSSNPVRYQLLIAPKENLPQGAFHGEATVEIERNNGAKEFGATLSIEGEVQPAIRLFPARILLGPNKIGDKASAIVVLQAPKDSQPLVEQIEASAIAVNAKATSIDGIPDGRAFRVELKVEKEGDQSAHLLFVVRNGNRLERIGVEVTAYGLDSK